MKKPKEKKPGKPRLVIIREYSGNQSLRDAFEQIVEKQACQQFEYWKEKKAG